MLTQLLLIGLGVVAGLLLVRLNHKPKDELMAAIDDLKASVDRLEKAREKLLANLPPDLTAEISVVTARVNAVSDSLEAATPPTV